jgi:Tfp pilus assembly protein PilE
MKAKRKQSGLTLTEMTLVIASIAVLVVLAVPAIRAFFNSFETETAAKTMISAALASARSVAIREQRYAGIRFQKAYRPDSTLQAPQYITFVVYDPGIMADCIRAVEGLKPMKLPDSVGVIDLTLVTNRNTNNPVNSTQVRLDDPAINASDKDDWFKNLPALTDMSTFSIIFSPEGRLVNFGVQVRNKNGQRDTNANAANVSNDVVFNKIDRVKIDSTDQIRPALFCQDDYYGKLDNIYGDLGLGPEPSRNGFMIYENNKFRSAYQKGQAYSGYLSALISETIYINPYTGTIISPD